MDTRSSCSSVHSECSEHYSNDSGHYSNSGSNSKVNQRQPDNQFRHSEPNLWTDAVEQSQAFVSWLLILDYKELENWEIVKKLATRATLVVAMLAISIGSMGIGAFVCMLIGAIAFCALMDNKQF